MPVIKTRTSSLPFVHLMRAICSCFFSDRPYALHACLSPDIRRQVGKETFVRALTENGPIGSSEGTALQRQIEGLALARLARLLEHADDDFLSRVKGLVLEREKHMIAATDKGNTDADEAVEQRDAKRADDSPSEVSS